MGPELVGKREQLGEALTELRIRAGLSVRDVADQSDALLGTVAGWFAGQHAPTKASTLSVGCVLLASVGYHLLLGEDPQPRELLL